MNVTNVTAGAEVVDWSSPNVHAAIGISIGAGLATGVGGALVFFPQFLKKVPQATVLAVSLALSAGVMIYVSFIEIFVKAQEAIANTEGFSDGGASAVTTVGFFGGCLLCALLEVFVHWLTSRGGAKHEDICPAHMSLPVAGESHTADEHQGSENASQASSAAVGALPSVVVQMPAPAANDVAQVKVQIDAPDGKEAPFTDSPEEKKKLVTMGIMTAAAIAIHNFPEGLATFLATVSEPSVGASLGVAIAIHNIPEGICVAMPVYYATGNKWKAFWWSLLSGVTEPIGGILGFAVLQPHFTDLVYGIIFSMVGGMMVFIVCHELLPAAHRYMGNSARATACLLIGMMIMAASLVLFAVA